MKCEEYINSYLLLDNGQKPSLLMRAHVLFCKVCRKEVRMLDAHFEEIRAMASLPDGRDLVESVMGIVGHTQTIHVKKVTTFQWVSVEFIILASLVLVQFSPAKIWLDAMLGEVFHMLISATLGVVITLFSAVLVLTHIDELNAMKERFIAKIR